MKKFLDLISFIVAPTFSILLLFIMTVIEFDTFQFCLWSFFILLGILETIYGILAYVED